MEKEKQKPWWKQQGFVRRTYDLKEETLMRLDRTAATLRISRVALLDILINRYCMTEKERQEARDEHSDIF